MLCIQSYSSMISESAQSPVVTYISWSHLHVLVDSGWTRLCISLKS